MERKSRYESERWPFVEAFFMKLHHCDGLKLGFSVDKRSQKKRQ